MGQIKAVGTRVTVKLFRGGGYYVDPVLVDKVGVVAKVFEPSRRSKQWDYLVEFDDGDCQVVEAFRDPDHTQYCPGSVVVSFRCV
jgi:hypothetical protein